MTKSSFLAAAARHSGVLLLLPIASCGLRLADEAVTVAVGLLLCLSGSLRPMYPKVESSWLNFGRPAPPGRGSAAGRNFFLAPPCYSQRAVFASLWALFTQRAKLSGAVYCNRSCLWVCLRVCGSVTTIKMDVNRRFQAKWTKYKNRSISYNKNTTNVQFQEDVKTIKQKLGWFAMTSYQIQHNGRPPFWKSKIRNNYADSPIFTNI